MKEISDLLLKNWGAHLAIVGKFSEEGMKFILWSHPSTNENRYEKNLFSYGNPQEYELHIHALNSKQDVESSAIANLSNLILTSLPLKSNQPRTSDAPTSETLTSGKILLFSNFDTREMSPNSPISSVWKQTEGGAINTDYAMNMIPEGNPDTQRYMTLEGVSLPSIDVTEYAKLRISFFLKSTSNPRPRSIHNCDSSLNVYFRKNDDDWKHRMAYCGSYPNESGGWSNRTLDFDVKDIRNIGFRFVYGIQNTDSQKEKERRKAVYLIDEIKVVGHME